jgi:hypothetical protein
MDSGVLGASDFAGWDSQAEATRLVKDAWDQFQRRPSIGFRWVRACDFAPLPKKVLMSMSQEAGGQECVMVDIGDRLPSDISTILAQMVPPKV